MLKVSVEVGVGVVSARGKRLQHPQKVSVEVGVEVVSARENAQKVVLKYFNINFNTSRK